jgi:heptosyltransferase-1
MPEPGFLVLRLGSLGDIVHTFPAVAGLKESFPKSEIVWLVDERWRPLVERSDLATAVWTSDTRSWSSVRAAIRRIRQRNWQAAIDYQGLWKTALFPFLGGVRRRIGFDSATIREFGVPAAYTEKVRAKAEHIADQNGELSVRAGARNGVAGFSLRINADEEEQSKEIRQRNGLAGYCVLCPGAGWQAKCWPAERYGALCVQVRNEFGFRCVVNYGPGEEELAKRVRAAGAKAEPVLAKSAMGELMALLRGAEAAIGGDTGPLHLAVALGARVVALYGPTDPRRNGPYRSDDIVLRSPDARTDHARGDRPAPSMLQISVDAVAEAVKRRLETQR